MNTEEIIREIEAEIERLTRARDLVRGEVRQRSGRNARKSASAAPKGRAARRKRTLSPEGRARIAAAQKLRWSKQKRTKEKS